MRTLERFTLANKKVLFNCHGCGYRCRGGDRLESRPDSVIIKDVKMVPTAAMSCARHKYLE